MNTMTYQTQELTVTVHWRMSFHEKLSAGNFSLNCFSTASGMMSCGSFMNAAKMSAVPPDPAKISQGAEFSKPLQILCSLK